MNIPAYWDGFAKLPETAFIGETSYAAALECLEKDQHDKAITAFRDWAGKATDPAAIVRAAALFDVARARRAFINRNLETAASTLATAASSVPEAIVLSVLMDYVSAGGDEALLGTWVEQAAKSGKLASKLTDLLGSPARVSALVNLLSPSSAFSILSVIDEKTFDALAKSGFARQLRELAMVAAFEPRVPRLARQMVKRLPDFGKARPKGVQAWLSVLLTLSHPVLVPRAFASVGWVKLAARISSILNDPGEVAGASQVAPIGQVDGADTTRLLFDWLAERYAVAPQSDEPRSARKAEERYEQAIRCLAELGATRLDDGRFDGLIEEAMSIGIAEPRLREFRLLKGIAAQALQQPFTLADLLNVKDRAGIGLADLLSLIGADDLCRKETWAELDIDQKRLLTEPPAFAIVARAIAREIDNHRSGAAAETVEFVTDAVLAQGMAARAPLIAPVLALLDKLTTNGTLSTPRGRELIRRLWLPSTDGDPDLFKVLDARYADFSSSETFIGLWREYALRASALGALDASPQLIERMRARPLQESQGSDEPLSSRIAWHTFLGDHDLALKTLRSGLPASGLSIPEKTALSDSAYRLALSYADDGEQRKARIALVTAASLGLAPFMAAALEIGRLGRAAHQSQHLPDVLAKGDAIRFYLRLTELMPAPQALSSLEGLPLHHFTSLATWRRAATEPEFLERGAAAMAALLESLGVREEPDWDRASFAIDVAKLVLGDLHPASQPIVADALADLIDRDDVPAPIFHAASGDWNNLRLVWLAAQRRAGKVCLAKLGQVLSQVSAEHRIVVAIVLEDLSPAQFGKRLLAEKPRPVELALALFSWLKPGLGRQYLEQLPAPALVAASAWKDVLDSAATLLQEREGFRQTIAYIVAEVDAFEQLLPLLTFFARAVPALPPDTRSEVLDLIAPLSERLVKEGDANGKPGPRRLERSLYRVTTASVGTAPGEDQRPGFRRSRLYALSVRPQVDTPALQLEADALLDDSSFVLSSVDQWAKVRLLLLLHRDEQALALAERYDPPPTGDDPGLGALLVEAVARSFASGDMAEVQRAVAVSAKCGAPASVLHAYDLLSGNSGADVRRRADSVIASRSGLVVLAEIQRACPERSASALSGLPLAAFAGPPPAKAPEDMEEARAIAQSAPFLAEICTRLSRTTVLDGDPLALASYLSGTVAPLVRSADFDNFDNGLRALIERLSRAEDPVGAHARAIHKCAKSFDETDETSPYKHYVSGFIERILADGLVNEGQDRANAGELLDQAERTGEALSPRQRIWLTATSGRIADLKSVINEGGLKTLQDGEASRLQNFLFSNAAADASAGRNVELPNVKIALEAIGKSPELDLLVDWLGYWGAGTPLLYLTQLKTLAAKSSALTVTISAIEHLPADYRSAFAGSLPAFILRSSAQWGDKKLAKIVARHPSSILCVLESMTHRLMGDERDGMRQAAEVFSKNLLPALPLPIRLACHGYLISMDHTLSATKQGSATLRKAYSGRVPPAELTKALSLGAKNYGPDVAGAIIMSRALMTKRSDKLIDIVPQFELYGGFEQARAIIAPLLKSDPGLQAAFTDLRLAYALGDRDSANQQARAIVTSTKNVQLSVLDRLRLTLFAPVLKGKRTKLLRRLTGLQSSRQRIARAQAAAKASLLLDDPQQTRERFARLTSFSPSRFAPSEIGVLVLLRDFVGAESITTRLIDRLQANKRRGEAPFVVVQKLEQILPFVALLQSHFLNEGRDPQFMPTLKALAVEISPTRALQNLKPVDSKRLTGVLIKLLRLSLRGTNVDQIFDVHCIEAVLTASSGDDAICARLGQTLASHWHARGAEIGHRALAHAVSVLQPTKGTEPLAGDTPAVGTPPKALNVDISGLDLKEASRVAKALSTVLSLAERVNDDATIAAYTPTAERLLEAAVPQKWSSHPAFIGLANRCLTTLDNVGPVITFLEAAHRIAPNDFEVIKALAVASMVNGQNAQAKRLVRQALQRSPNDRSLLTLLARAHENNSEISNALEANIKALSIAEGSALQSSESGDLVTSVLALRNTIATQKFWIETSKITHLVPAPRSEKIKGVVFGSFYRCMTSASITSVPLLELKKRGYDVVYLNSGTLSAEPTGHKVLDQFSSIIHGDGSFVRGARSNRGKLFHSWVVDPENRQITANGLNFYQPIFERLTQEARSFTLDFSSDTVRHRIRAMILRCDRALYVAERIRNEVAAKGIPVRFVSANWQYPPYCTFRIACQAWGNDYDMSFVAVSPGYESYFANLGKRFSTTAAAVNMTRNPTSRAPFLPVGGKFARWYEANGDVVDAAQGEIREQIQADRAGTGSTMSPEAKACFDRVQAHRARGGKVVCAFGKIVFDLAVPYAGGPAHADMEDFINHTVEAAAKAPETLLLVKPHPHELRYEIARNPRQYFTDLISMKPLPPNVILLGHRWFNVRDIIKMVDLGVLWNGTTSVELGASGIPVVMCDDWGPRDYPVGHAAPRDRAHFEAIIKDPSSIKIDEAYQRRCTGLIKYLSTTDIMRPYQFVTRGLVNVDVGPPVWHLESIQDYLRDGDEYVSALADDYMF